VVKRVFFPGFVIPLILLLLAGQSQAEERQLTLDHCISIALSSNPRVLSAIQTYQASLARIGQAKARPQLSVDYNSDLQPQLFNFVDSAEAYLGASYTFEFPGKRSLRGSIAEREAQETNVDIDLLRIELAFLVKEGFYQVLPSFIVDTVKH